MKVTPKSSQSFCAKNILSEGVDVNNVLVKKYLGIIEKCGDERVNHQIKLNDLGTDMAIFTTFKDDNRPAFQVFKSFELNANQDFIKKIKEIRVWLKAIEKQSSEWVSPKR